MSILTLNLDGITDQYIREELRKIQDHANENILSRGSFRAFSINKPAGTFKINHGFNFVPNVFLYAGGSGSVPSIDPKKADKTTFEVTISSPTDSIFIVGYINKKEIRS